MYFKLGKEIFKSILVIVYAHSIEDLNLLDPELQPIEIKSIIKSKLEGL